MRKFRKPLLVGRADSWWRKDKQIGSMKTYSIDLRKKIIEVLKEEKISQRQLAKRFRVALSFITKLVKQERETGTVEPRPYKRGVKLKLNQEQLRILSKLIEENNDATLSELCEMIKEKTGVAVSRATMGRMTKRLNLTVKKKLYQLEKKKQKECKK